MYHRNHKVIGIIDEAIGGISSELRRCLLLSSSEVIKTLKELCAPLLAGFFTDEMEVERPGGGMYLYSADRRLLRGTLLYVCDV